MITKKMFYTRKFEVFDYIPSDCEDLEEVKLDVEERSEVAYNYDFFKYKNEDDEEVYVAFPKDRDREIVIKDYPSNIEIWVYDEVYRLINEEYGTEHLSLMIDGLEFDDEDEIEEWIEEKIIDIELGEDDRASLISNVKNIILAKLGM